MKIIEESLSSPNVKGRSFTALENHYKLSQIQALIPNVIIAGGAARQIYLGEVFGSTDIDCYNANYREQATIWDNHFRFIPGNPNANITRNAFNFLFYDNKIQLVKKIYTDNIEELFNSFDFACCMFAIKGDKLYYTEKAAEDAIHKWITVINPPKILKGIDFAGASYEFCEENNLNSRVGKYLKKGYIPHCEYSLMVLEDCLKHCNGYQPLFLDFFDNRPEIKHEVSITELFDSFFGYYPEGY